MVTTGPGSTNTLTVVAAGWMDSTPMLIISGQVKRDDLCHGLGVRQMGFQEINIIPIVETITKYAVTIKDPESIDVVKNTTTKTIPSKLEKIARGNSCKKTNTVNSG